MKKIFGDVTTPPTVDNIFIGKWNGVNGGSFIGEWNGVSGNIFIGDGGTEFSGGETGFNPTDTVTVEG